VVLAPTSKEEYLNMLDWSIEQKEHPVMILMPGNAVTSRSADKDFSKLNTFKIEQSGEKVAILALGDFYQRGEELSEKIKSELGFMPTLVNPRFASGIDEQLLFDLMKKHQLVISLEDGILEGGFGQKIAAFYADKNMKVKIYGLKKEFYDRYNPQELLRQLGMTTEQILADIKNLLKSD
jgi:1-deoxy-D-xylulose-5-phosphate synthase